MIQTLSKNVKQKWSVINHERNINFKAVLPCSTYVKKNKQTTINKNNYYVSIHSAWYFYIRVTKKEKLKVEKARKSIHFRFDAGYRDTLKTMYTLCPTACN